MSSYRVLEMFTPDLQRRRLISLHKQQQPTTTSLQEEPVRIHYISLVSKKHGEHGVHLELALRRLRPRKEGRVHSVPLEPKVVGIGQGYGKRRGAHDRFHLTDYKRVKERRSRRGVFKEVKKIRKIKIKIVQEKFQNSNNDCNGDIITIMPG